MRLPHSEIDRYRGVAETTLRDLLAFENTEHETEQPVALITTFHELTIENRGLNTYSIDGTVTSFRSCRSLVDDHNIVVLQIECASAVV